MSPSADPFAAYQKPPEDDPFAAYQAAPDSWSQAKKAKPQPNAGQRVLNYATDTLSNIPSSAANLAGNAVSAVAHPFQTGEALLKTGAGVVQKMNPRAVPPTPQGQQSTSDFRPYADAAWDALKNRYGSPHAIAESIRTDPVGVASDISALAGGVSGAARGAGALADAANLPRVASGAGKVSEVAGAVSDATNPVALAGKVASRIPAPHKLTPEGMYQSALRPGLSRKNLPKIDREVATGLREEIPVSRSGYQQARDLSEQIGNEDAAKIAAAGGSASPIPATDVTGRTQGLYNSAWDQVNPNADQAAIEAVNQEFLSRQGAKAAAPAGPPTPTGLLDPYGKPIMNAGAPAVAATPPSPLGVEEAQRVKQGTYRGIREKYGSMGPAEVEAQKALARGLKEEIMARVPDLQGARQADVIDLEGQLQRFVGREGNKNLVGLIPAVLGAGTGAAMGHTGEGALAGAATTLAVMAMDNPAIKSQIAIMLNRARGMAPAAMPIARGVNAAAVAGEIGGSVAKQMGLHIYRANNPE